MLFIYYFNLQIYEIILDFLPFYLKKYSNISKKLQSMKINIPKNEADGRLLPIVRFVYYVFAGF